jgi:hypothetical protein
LDRFEFKPYIWTQQSSFKWPHIGGIAVSQKRLVQITSLLTEIFSLVLQSGAEPWCAVLQIAELIEGKSGLHRQLST